MRLPYSPHVCHGATLINMHGTCFPVSTPPRCTPSDVHADPCHTGHMLMLDYITEWFMHVMAVDVPQLARGHPEGSD